MRDFAPTLFLFLFCLFCLLVLSRRKFPYGFGVAVWDCVIGDTGSLKDLGLPVFAGCTALLFCSCTVVRKDASGAVTGALVGTDAEAVVIDGPLPQVVGLLPIYNKQGLVIGQRPIYGAGTPGERALFAAYGFNQTQGLGKVTNAVLGYGLGLLTADVAKAKDAGVAANEARAIDAKAATDKAGLANEAARDGYKHAEAMVEIPAAVVP